MSIAALNWAMQQTGISPEAKLLLLLLADNGAPDLDLGEIDDGELAARAEMTVDSVRVYVQELVDQGLLWAQFHGSGNGLLHYELLFAAKGA